jgi:hypothetical protein
LVTLLTPLVNELRLPITFEEKFCTPPTTEAANVEPGNDVDRPPDGTDMDAGVAVVEVMGAERYIGS